MKLWLIERLLDPHISRSRNEFQLVQQIVGKLPIALQIIADNPGCRSVRAGRNSGFGSPCRWQEIKRDAREPVYEIQPQIVHILRRGVMIVRE